MTGQGKPLSFRLLGSIMGTPPDWQCLCYVGRGECIEAATHEGRVCPTLLEILGVLHKHESAEAQP